MTEHLSGFYPHSQSLPGDLLAASFSYQAYSVCVWVCVTCHSPRLRVTLSPISVRARSTKSTSEAVQIPEAGRTAESRRKYAVPTRYWFSTSYRSRFNL
jgi:hypothetical protein